LLVRELFRKDLAELRASRAWWLLLAVVGLLTGQAFITAVRTYAEMSAPQALAQGLSPLDGIVVPALGAYDLAIMLLFPFVAIRLIAAERESGGLKLVLQWPVTRTQVVSVKVAALVVAWIASLIPFAIALILWRFYGGHLAWLETANVITGYTLRLMLTVALSMIAGAILPGSGNAAVALLAFTIGTWALDFLGAAHGGLLQTLASYTPQAATRSFEQGLFRVDVALVLLIVAAGATTLTAICIDFGAAPRRRLLRAIVTIAVTAVAATLASHVHTSFDVSENRRNSFSPEEQQALARISKPLRLVVWLANDDPRLADLERNVLLKLRRTIAVDVDYPLASRTALFEDEPRYGTVEYRLDGKQAVSRSTTEPIVIATLCELAGVPAPAQSDSGHAGYPLRAVPRGAAWIFYFAWPLFTLLAALYTRRTGSRSPSSTTFRPSR
jgi:ABC-2 type transport system permease protein